MSLILKHLNSENSDLFRISHFEFRIFPSFSAFSASLRGDLRTHPPPLEELWRAGGLTDSQTH